MIKYCSGTQQGQGIIYFIYLETMGYYFRGATYWRKK